MNFIPLREKDQSKAFELFDKVDGWDNFTSIDGFVSVDDEDNATVMGLYAHCLSKPYAVSILWTRPDRRREGLGDGVSHHFFNNVPIGKKIWIGAYSGYPDIDVHFHTLFKSYGLVEEDGEYFYTRT